MDLKEQVAELIKQIQSCAEGLDEWSIENYTEEDKDQLAAAHCTLATVLEQVGRR